jgi:hypothetical protein
VAPYEHHGRTGCGTQQHRTGKVLVGQISGDERLEQHEKEEPGDAKHGKRLDQPVGHPGDQDAFRLAAHIFHAVEIYLQHHGEDHQPDQDGYRDGYIGILELMQCGRHGWDIETYQYARHNTDSHP